MEYTPENIYSYLYNLFVANKAHKVFSRTNYIYMIGYIDALRETSVITLDAGTQVIRKFENKEIPE